MGGATTNKHMLKNIKFTPGKIVYFDFDIDSNLSLNNYDEDMLQVEYTNKIILDAGWHAGLKKFLVYIVKNYD